jgi:hypothetical protein
MAEMKTGQIDAMIEHKVDQQIDTFVRDIADKISNFIKQNGYYDGGSLYVPSEWESTGNGTKKVKELSYESIFDFRKGLNAGLQKQLKEKMIAKATKDLLEKVSLLS